MMTTLAALLGAIPLAVSYGNGAELIGAAQTAADVTLTQFNAGTVPNTTVITDIATLLAHQESLLTIEQNRLIAVVTLIEALGGGWDPSQAS